MKSPTMRMGMEKKNVNIDPSLLLKHTPLCCLSQIAMYTIKTILLGKQKYHGTFVCLLNTNGNLRLNTINYGLYLKDRTRINKLC